MLSSITSLLSHDCLRFFIHPRQRSIRSVCLHHRRSLGIITFNPQLLRPRLASHLLSYQPSSSDCYAPLLSTPPHLHLLRSPPSIHTRAAPPLILLGQLCYFTNFFPALGFQPKSIWVLGFLV